jgi:hypothetical protein
MSARAVAQPLGAAEVHGNSSVDLHSNSSADPFIDPSELYTAYRSRWRPVEETYKRASPFSGSEVVLLTFANDDAVDTLSHTSTATRFDPSVDVVAGSG